MYVARMVKLYTPNRYLLIDTEFKQFLLQNAHCLEAYMKQNLNI